MHMNLKDWASGLSSPVITRFAPSPGGWLHLGHVLSAMYVWGLGRALGGRIILRIEDHDRTRARQEYEQGILDDLDWLGLSADAGVANVDHPSPHRQSDHLQDYEDVLRNLQQRGLAYACDCTRKQIKQRAPQPGDELWYDGFCRERGLPINDETAVRVRIPNEDVTFLDARHGMQLQNPASQCGDWTIRDRYGNFTYNAAVTKDDMRDQVNLIIRGDDLLHATGRQLQLRKLLGESGGPLFFHHPLVRSGNEKLSKRDGALGIRELRAQGRTPAEVWALATMSVGIPPLKSVHEAERYFKRLLE